MTHPRDVRICSLSPSGLSYFEVGLQYPDLDRARVDLEQRRFHQVSQAMSSKFFTFQVPDYAAQLSIELR